MARVLLLTQVLPYPLDAGPKVRAYYMLRHLVQRHDVTLISFTRADDRQESIEHLAGLCKTVYTAPMVRSMARNVRAGIKGLVTGLPMYVARDDVPEMSALLRRLVQETRFDLIHADQLSMAWYALLAARATPPSLSSPPRLLLDAHNAIYRLTERMAAEAGGLRRLIIQREARAFRRYEADMVRRFDAVLTVTDEDRALLLDLFAEPERSQQAAKLTTLPICIDPTQVAPIDHFPSPPSPINHSPSPPSPINHSPSPPSPISHSPFPPSPINHSPFPPSPINHSPFPNSPINHSPFPTPHSPSPTPHSPSPTPHSPSPTILHLGTMFWPPNVSGVLWFAREVLPLIWQQQPQARFVVVGKNPPAEVQALAADPRITVTGYVADPLPFLQAADAFVVPLHSGGGMRVKILDAWLWGLPIVSTPIGAEGIELVEGENILLAGDAPAFAAATLRLLADGELNQRLRLAGRRWVEQRYAWQVVYQRVDALLG